MVHSIHFSSIFATFMLHLVYYLRQNGCCLSFCTGVWGSVLSVLRILIILLFTGTLATTTTASQSILVLHSYHQGLSWTDGITKGIQDIFASHPNAELHFEYLDSKRNTESAMEKVALVSLHEKYRLKPPDVVIVSDNAAFDFARRNHEALFAKTPIVFCGVNDFQDSLLDSSSVWAGVVENTDTHATLEMAKRLQPDLRRVIILTDGTLTGIAHYNRMGALFKATGAQPVAEFWHNLPFDTVRTRLKRLNPNTDAVFLTALNRDSQGLFYTFEQAAALVTQNSPAPVYGFWDFYLGHGIVGGHVVSGIDQGRTAAELAVRILHGESPASVGIIRESPNRTYADYSILQKHGLSEKQLLPGTVLIHKPSDWLKENIVSIMLILGLMVAEALIIALLAFLLNRNRKRAMNALRQSENRFRALFEQSNAPQAIFEKGQYIDCNQAMLKLFGVQERSDLLYKNMLDLSPTYQPSGIRSAELFTSCKQNKDLVSSAQVYEWSHQKSNGLIFPVIAMITPVPDSDRTLYHVLLHDISEQKRTEADLIESKRSAEAANKAKSVFLANMSHEIRTPLNGIIGFSDLLMKSPMNETQREYMQTVQHSAHSLLDLINDILDFSKIEAGKLELFPERTDLFDLCEQVADLVKHRLLEKSIELVIAPSIRLPRFATVDQIRLRQILVNLMGNALKFTEQGEVVLSVHAEDIPLAPMRKIFHFAVRDTGIGVPSEKQKTIFDSFSQADPSTTRKYGGSGLGLAITQRLLQKMDSTLVLQSEPGKGSVFSFSLALTIENGNSLFSPTIQGSHRALILYNNKSNLFYLQNMLEAQGIQTFPAENLADTMHIAKTKSDLNLILADTRLFPPASHQQISLLHPQAHIILLDPRAEQLITEGPERTENIHFLRTPIRITQTVQLIRSLCLAENQKQQLHHPSIQVEPSKQKTSPTILVVEDNHVNMVYACTVIMDVFPDAQIVKADNGLQAVQFFKERQPQLVLMDVQMPIMDGYTATHEIRNFEASKGKVPTKIIALTAGTSQGELERCTAAGMNSYLAKPVVYDTMRQMLIKSL